MLKKFIFAGMIGIFSLSAMDTCDKHVCAEKCYQAIRDRIDTDILGVAKDAWFRGVVATIKGDVLRAGGLDPVHQLITLEGKIPHECRNDQGLYTLWSNHLHFRALVENIAQDIVVKQLKDVSGKNIADFFHPKSTPINPQLSPEMHQLIRWRAAMPYLRDVVTDFNWRPWLMRFDRADENIDFVQLHGHEINLVEKLELLYARGTDYYLRGTKKQGGQLFWSLNDGKECDAIPAACENKKIHAKDSNNTSVILTELCETSTICSRNSYIEFGDMLIILGADGATKGTRAIIDQLHKPEIVVFQKPSFLSCVCLRAFLKSKKEKDKEGLLALQKFVNEQQSLSGEIRYPKANLLRMICKELTNFD